jgi:hypothetical protein
MKNRILLFFNLDIIVLILFNALTGLFETFNFLFLFIIIYSPSGVALISRILVIYIVPTFLLNIKAVRADIKNNLDLNFSPYFILAIFLFCRIRLRLRYIISNLIRGVIFIYRLRFIYILFGNILFFVEIAPLLIRII